MAQDKLLNDEWEDITTLNKESDWEDVDTLKTDEGNWEDIEVKVPEPARQRSYGVTGDFGPTFVDKIIKFATAGHITHPTDYLPIEYDPETGDPISEPSVRMGFFEDPVSMLTMGGALGALRPAAGLGQRLTRATREAAGWFTGGISEAPRVAATGAKAAARAASAKQLEKTTAKAVAQPLGKETVEVTTKAGVEAGARTVMLGDPELLYHGADKIGAELIEKQGYLGGHTQRTFLTPSKQLAERYAESGTGGGKVFAIRKSDLPLVLRGEGQLSIPQKQLQDLHIPIYKPKPLPKYAQSVNLEKQSVSDSAKRLEVEMSGPKKYQSWDQTEELGNKILEDINKTNKVLAKAKKGEGLVAEEMHVVKQVNVNAIDRLAKLEEEFAAGKMTEEAFQKEFQLMKDDIWNVVNNPRSELGRAMNYMKKAQEVTDQMGQALAKIEGKMTPRQREAFAAAVKNKENPVAVSRFLDTIEDPKLRDYIMEFWYNSILSGPPTHVVNIASNTAWSMYQIPHRVHTAMWDKIWTTFTGAARTRYIDEVIPMMAGYKTGFAKGARSAKDMLRYGQIAEFETKWAQEIGYKAVGAWEKSPNALMRKAGPLVSAPTRALRAMDVWANSIAYSGEINSIARMTANNKGLVGVARENFEREFKKDLPKWAHEKAMKWAKHNTFMDDPDKFTGAFLKLRETVPLGIGRFVVPFVNTIGNLTKRGLEFTPGVGIAKEAISRSWGRGLGTPEIIAKQIEGTILSAYIWHKFDQGDLTGAAPQSENARERFYAQGKKPWAIKIGNTWIQYRRIEPWNTPIAAVAIARDKFKNAKDDTTRTEIFGQVARGMVNNLIDSSYLQGLSAVFNRYETGKTFPSRFGASFVPYSSLWRSVNRAYEKATEGEVKLRERERWLSALAQVIPGLSQKVKAELDVWGEEKVIPGSIFQHWLPYKWSEAVNWETDSVEKAIEILNKPTDISFYPGLPNQRVTIKGKKVKLDDDIYRKFCIDYGNKAKTALKIKVESPNWQRILRNKEENYYGKLINKMDTMMTKYRNSARKRAIREQRKRMLEDFQPFQMF